MSEEDKSALSLYSLGIVVETKAVGSDTIMVTPIEHLNLQDNKLVKDNKQEYKNTLPDKDGKVNSSVAKGSSTLKAKWLPLGQSNRSTAPDVVANETVLLFKYADVDEYYWTTIFRENSLRRLESVLYSYSNLPSGIKEYSMTTSYWMLMSTKNKKVQFHTSSNDGEHCTYDISLDTKQGVLRIEDGKKNVIELSSKSDTLNVAVNKDVAVNAGNTVVVVAGSSATVKAPAITLDGNVTITGSLGVKGSTTTNGLSVNGPSSAGGSLSVSGSVAVGGSVNVSGDVNASNI